MAGRKKHAAGARKTAERRRSRDEATRARSASPRRRSSRTARAETMTSSAAFEDRPEGMGAQLVSAAVVGAGALLLEVELLPGILLGVAAMMLPKMVPQVGEAIRPVAKSVARAGQGLASRVQSFAAEASEQVQDILAEVKTESGRRTAATAAAQAAGAGA